MNQQKAKRRLGRWRRAALALAAAGGLLLTGAVAGVAPAQAAPAAPAGSVADAFASASAAYGVPQPLLKAVCFLEGRMSAHHGQASVDGGYGCMHLAHNPRTDTLDQAATLLNIPVATLETDTAANITGGAAVLRAEALSVSATHTLPSGINEWYTAVASYSHSSSREVAGLYADAVYRLVGTGFQGVADDGETIGQSAQAVSPDRSGLSTLPLGPNALPNGCVQDSNVDYPAAVDCVVPAAQFDCNVTSPCTYQGSTRPTSYAVNLITTHDIEGTGQDALNVFQDRTSGVSAHYIVDSDGTVYQVIREKDIAYHAGNFYYNEHAVGVEHAGFDADGYQWYNATEYLASAKLSAYLLKKYNIPLDHAHITAHGTTPAPTTGTSPNHVDPGRYWLWDYYFGLINAQGVAFPTGTAPAGVFRVNPASDQQPLGANGTETSANNSFFTLYTGPSTTSGVIPHAPGTDPTDETSNVETRMPYYYLASQPDQAGTGMIMYEVWYGESDRISGSNPSQYLDAKLAWLAVPAGSAAPAVASVVQLKSSSKNSSTAKVYGRPTTSSGYVIGSAQIASVFASPKTVIEDGTGNLWYAVDFNHREAWVPAAEVTVLAHP